MFFIKKIIIKNKIKKIEVRVDVINRLIKLNESKINANNTKLTKFHYENQLYIEEKTNLLEELESYYKLLFK